MIHSLLQSVATFLFPSRCFICKKGSDLLCRECLASLPAPLDTPHHFITARFSYKDPRIKRIIHAIKFFNRKDLLIPLSEEMLTLLPEKKDSAVLVPIPMPVFRRLIRGYNQSKLLAKELSSVCGIPFNASLLKRTTSPVRQVTTRNRNERLRNQKGAFSCGQNTTGKDIILIDDVTTTGSTLLEARKVLIDGGARSVIAITIAH